MANRKISLHMLISSCIYQESGSPAGSTHKDTRHQDRAAGPWVSACDPVAFPPGLGIPTWTISSHWQQQQFQNTKRHV